VITSRIIPKICFLTSRVITMVIVVLWISTIFVQSLTLILITILFHARSTQA
jgi:hypothetical protein